MPFCWRRPRVSVTWECIRRLLFATLSVGAQYKEIVSFSIPFTVAGECRFRFRYGAFHCQGNAD